MNAGSNCCHRFTAEDTEHAEDVTEARWTPAAYRA